MAIEKPWIQAERPQGLGKIRMRGMRGMRVSMRCNEYFLIWVIMLQALGDI